MSVIHFAKVGQVECNRRMTFWWSQGYAEVHPDGSTSQPWVTRPEACADARTNGSRARFHETVEDAVKAQQ